MDYILPLCFIEYINIILLFYLYFRFDFINHHPYS